MARLTHGPASAVELDPPVARGWASPVAESGESPRKRVSDDRDRSYSIGSSVRIHPGIGTGAGELRGEIADPGKIEEKSNVSKGRTITCLR
ncbi:MAG: hypothetical protein AAF654_13700 [Myxococcota bacterium]